MGTIPPSTRERLSQPPFTAGLLRKKLVKQRGLFKGSRTLFRGSGASLSVERDAISTSAGRATATSASRVISTSVAMSFRQAQRGEIPQSRRCLPSQDFTLPSKCQEAEPFCSDENHCEQQRNMHALIPHLHPPRSAWLKFEQGGI